MSPSTQTMGFFMSEINFCNTKEQLNHLGEVVTGKTNGSPNGADIDTSTLPYTGQVRKTLSALETEYLEAIQGAGGVSIGVWTSGVTTFNAYNEYAVYNGIPYKPRTTTTLPYVVQGADPTVGPDDANVQPYQEITEAQVVALVEDTVQEYTDLVYTSINDMISGNPVLAKVGDTTRFGNFTWERVSTINGNIDDFELVSVGGLSSTAKYNKIAVAIKSLAVDEWYVNQSTGQDVIGAGYDVSTPARTIQFVIDSMPDMLSARYTQKINLSAGTFNESSRPTSEMARPAIVWPNDKFISNRTTQASGAIAGALVIEGKGVGVSIIQTNPTDGYLYGVYASGCEIALYNLSVLADESVGVSDSSSLVVSHRGAYVHGKNIHIGSVSAQLGLVCEAGGWAEMISSTIKDCGGTDVVVYQDSAASLAGTGSDIGHITNNGFLQLAENCVVNGDQLHTPGSQCQVTSSQASTKPTVNGSISGRGSQLNAAFADFNGLISCEMSGIRMTACGYQEQITMFGGDILLSGTNSYTDVNTQNNSLTPITLRDNASFKTDASSNIVNSNGDTIGPDYGNLQVSVGSNGFAIPVSITGREIDMEVIGAGSNRTGATLPLTSSAGPYGDGQVLRLTGAGFNVQIVDNLTAEIPGGSVTVGGQPGAYSGATFIYIARTSKWRLQGVSLQY